MNKTLLYVTISVFGAIGGWLPSMFGDASLFSVWGILGSTIGGLFGIFVAVKLSE